MLLIKTIYFLLIFKTTFYKVWILKYTKARCKTLTVKNCILRIVVKLLFKTLKTSLVVDT